MKLALVAQMVKNLPAMWEIWVQALGWEDPWRRKWQPTLVFLLGEFHGPLSMGILQARILERVAMPSSRGSSQLRD